MAGVPVSYVAAGELAWRLTDAGLGGTADYIADVIAVSGDTVSLTITEREAALRVLEDGPHELADLRATLLAERDWREATSL